MKKLQKPNCKELEIYQCYTNESNLKNNVITTVTGGVVSGIFAVVIAA